MNDTTLSILTSARDRLAEEVNSNQEWRSRLEQKIEDSLQREAELLTQIEEVEAGIAALTPQ